MSAAVFERIIEQVELNKEHIKVIVLYHGGEPLLNKNFYNYIERLKDIKSDLFIKTVSNGMALTPSVIDRILKSRLDAIEFSLDGLSADESEYVRVKSKTARVVENVERFLSEKAKRGLKKPDVSIATTQFIRDQTSEIPEKAPVPQWLSDRFRNAVGYKAGFAMVWPHMNIGEKFDTRPTVGEDIDDCDHINATMTVRSDGAVVPCCYDLTSQLVMGHVLTDSLSEIWTGRKYTMLRRAIKNKTYPGICGTCAVVKPPVYLIPKWNEETLAVA